MGAARFPPNHKTKSPGVFNSGAFCILAVYMCRSLLGKNAIYSSGKQITGNLANARQTDELHISCLDLFDGVVTCIPIL